MSKFIEERQITISYGKTITDGNYGSDKYGLSMTVNLEEGEDIQLAVDREYEMIREVIDELIAKDK